ncbi:MAG: YidC/Oxa1 family insertase periplasmic-domain containing protein, partial [Kiritimatiellae bacterium]|nr:YidC/Oxa1 family insertase periplasmic-domain containing protein [Kiritimatiellia bacterium]
GQNPPAAPEQFAVLDNGELAIVLSTRGGAIASVTLAGYRQSLDKDSPALTFDFGDARALAISGVPGANADFSILSASATNAVLSCALASGATLTRTFTLLPGYQVALEDALSAPAGGGAQASMPEAAISIGSLSRQSRGSTAVLSVDNLPVSAPDGKAPKVLHWERKRLLSKLFTGGSGSGFGCASAPDGAQFPPAASASYREPQRWVAIKTRFFAMALAGESAGYSVTASRSQERGPLSVKSVSASMLLPAATLAPGETLTRSFRLYIGPKKLSVLRSFAENSAEIMEFGTFKWLCVILIPILNGLNAVFHNYGVAIIVLTILVRLLFWPLTRKSNESMKKMGAIQPQLREIQEKFKGDPQKLQQETMRLYRENKVNPMSSCLPMLIQIPVFIALFVVLRTATELRFAPFLWIRDLSEPENILAGAFPGLPALNILPFLMAGTMFLQSKFTPSAGDPAQQKMMMWMMPLMMFFMFYSMPSALLLYWTVSQFLAIVQLLRQRRASAAATPVAADGTIDGDALSRQERRRLDRENAAR